MQRPAAVVRDVVLHAGLRRAQAERIAASSVSRRVAKEKQNSKASGHGRMPPAWRREVAALYAPFLDRFYSLVGEAGVPVSPCEERGTRFLDPPPQGEGEGEGAAPGAAPAAAAAVPAQQGRRRERSRGAHPRRFAGRGAASRAWRGAS